MGVRGGVTLPGIPTMRWMRTFSSSKRVSMANGPSGSCALPEASKAAETWAQPESWST